MKKRLVFNLFLLIILFLLLNFFPLRPFNLLAEKSGSSPDSGATDSRIKQAYDFLGPLGKNYTADALDWDSTANNWGTWWNWIMEAAAWEPDGTLTAGDVFYGKTFYSASDNRTQKTGTLNMSLQEYDDYESGDETAEESSWTNTAGSATTGVWKDNRTGLYWSASRGQDDNIFPDQDHSTCDFFNETLYPARGAYPGTDAQCGDAINACGILELDADSLEAGGDAGTETDWYLPAQKELQMAYIDGIYNQTNTTFVTTSYFWSSTEHSNDPANAWRVYLPSGTTTVNTKITATDYVRCVRRN